MKNKVLAILGIILIVILLICSLKYIYDETFGKVVVVTNTEYGRCTLEDLMSMSDCVVQIYRRDKPQVEAVSYNVLDENNKPIGDVKKVAKNYKMEVTDVFKGDIQGESVDISVIHNVIKNSYRLTEDGTHYDPKFETGGKSYIVFLKKEEYTNSYYPIVGGQGVFEYKILTKSFVNEWGLEIIIQDNEIYQVN